MQVESAKKDKTKTKAEEIMPGSLTPGLKKVLEEKADLFEQAGQACCAEIINDVKAVVASKLRNHYANLMSAIRDEFGTRGQTEAATHSGEWMQAIVADLLKSGFEPLVETIQSITDGTYAEASVESMPEINLRLLALAKKTYALGQKEVALDLFCQGMKTKADMGGTITAPPLANIPVANPMVGPNVGDDAVDDHGNTMSLSTEQIAKAKALANKIAAIGHKDLARKVLNAVHEVNQ